MPIKKAVLPQPLKTNDLRWFCNPKIFDFESTSELEPNESIIGQDRALRALKLGVNLRSPGYNIFIAGLSGTGKATAVQKILESISASCPTLKDYAYVNNFNDPDSPILLTFPQGQAKDFKKEISSLIQYLKDRIPQQLESQTFVGKRKKILGEYDKKEKELLSLFQKKIKKDGFALGSVQVGETARPEIIPLIQNKPIPVQQLDKVIQEGTITQEKAQNIIQKYNEYQLELMNLFKKGLKLSQKLQIESLDLERKEVDVLVKGSMAAFYEKYPDEKFSLYLHQVEESILENLQIFKGQKPENEETQEGFVIDYFREYDVNIVLDNSSTNTCPVVIEIAPSYTNLFGTIEKVNDGRGGWYADFTRIKAGSLLKANGGFLVLNATHVFDEPGVWKTLKRILTFRKLEIQDSYNFFQFQPSILKPEPIDVDLKVILIGSNYIYSMLAEYEDDFKKIFKVKADFDYEVKRTGEIIDAYARVIKKTIKEENLLEFDKTAIASLLELAAKYAGQKDKLTARFSVLADLVREAHYWAKEENVKVVSAALVKKAYEMAKDRHALYEEKLSDMIREKTILIDTAGEKIGQINGLAVYGSDFYAFGKPTRITASVSIGNGAIINVEREAGMSGKTYDKGVLVISGYFREMFGQQFPLSFSANLVFEQSYGMIDGDSASAAEFFALLSSLSGLPIKQSFAVTGSVNQRGEIQPIGGVNEKVEGFYSVCKMNGFTKNQGVIIPIQNVKDLMLNEEIINSVKKKEFAVYAISKIDEGIELLTGVSAGKLNKNGSYERNTVFGLVQQRLKDMYKKGKNPFKELTPRKKKQLPKRKMKR
ncbi:MAG: ATP-binding protein [Ignavibacteriaceae bacterium]|jgi:ATP-dependent Lon protease